MKTIAICVLLLICKTFAQDTSEGEEKPRDHEGTELRDYKQDWRVVDYFGGNPDTWLPHSEEQTPKRRRIRKRKRRPPVIDETEEIPRRRRPLDQIKEPWEEMSAETNQKSISRRRLTPVYDEPKVQIYEKIRDPFTALQQAEEKQKKEITTQTPNLKTLLKQSEGLSLSEVLQQKNLSLSELLKGNRQAISALAGEPETTTDSSKYKRLPPSVGLKKDINRNFESNEHLNSQEVVEAQRKRLALLHGHKDSKLFADVTRVDVVTEATTEKRIFISSSSTESTSKSIRKLPMTSAKLNKISAHHETTSKIPEKAVSIDLNEIFGVRTNSSDGPFKMTIDLEPVVTTQSSEKLKHVTAKEEIMEILNNPNEREKLARILRTRNMTVEELVQLRERGSSQLHLADIFHNKTREPEPKDEPFIGHIQPDPFDSPFFNRKPKTLIPVVTQPPPKPETTKVPYTITSFPTYKIETNREIQIRPLLPVWQQLSFFPDVYENNYRPEKESTTTTTTEKVNFEDIERLEEIENALAEAANEQLKIDLPRNDYEDDEDFIKIPSGVKSAILASLAIVGLSLLVFLTILVIFKWSQKQKRRLNYNGSFSGSKIRSPILEPDQRRTFKSFMSETLGRKKNYYKTHLQSMSDSIWDKEEKKSYMI